MKSSRPGGVQPIETKATIQPTCQSRVPAEQLDEEGYKLYKAFSEADLFVLNHLQPMPSRLYVYVILLLAHVALPLDALFCAT